MTFVSRVYVEGETHTWKKPEVESLTPCGPSVGRVSGEEMSSDEPCPREASRPRQAGQPLTGVLNGRGQVRAQVGALRPLQVGSR